MTNSPNSLRAGGGALRMMAPGGAATVRLSFTISLSTLGFFRPMEAAQVLAPGSARPHSLGSLVR